MSLFSSRPLNSPETTELTTSNVFPTSYFPETGENQTTPSTLLNTFWRYPLSRICQTQYQVVFIDGLYETSAEKKHGKFIHSIALP